MANGHGGKRPGAGTKPGVPRSEKTKKAHEAIHAAFEGIGGVKALTRWADENRDAFYERVWPKIIPVQMQHSGEDGGPIQSINEIVLRGVRPNAND